MNRRKIETLSGYKKLPDRIPWDHKNQDEYHRINQLNESFRTIAEGYLSNSSKCKIWGLRYYNTMCVRLKTDKKLQNEFSIDYSMSRFYQSEFNFFSAYTPFGIAGIESSFINQIKIIGTEECLFTFKELKECILRHPNLHPLKRNNLYRNLISHHKKIK